MVLKQKKQNCPHLFLVNDSKQCLLVILFVICKIHNLLLFLVKYKYKIVMRLYISAINNTIWESLTWQCYQNCFYL